MKESVQRPAGESARQLERASLRDPNSDAGLVRIKIPLFFLFYCVFRWKYPHSPLCPVPLLFSSRFMAAELPLASSSGLIYYHSENILKFGVKIHYIIYGSQTRWLTTVFYQKASEEK